METKRDFKIELLKSVIDEMQTFYAIKEGVTGILRFSTLEIILHSLTQYTPETVIEKGLIERIVLEIQRAMRVTDEKQYLSVRIAHIQAEKLLSALVDN